MTEPPQPKRPRRRLALIAAVGFGLVLVLLAVVYATRIPIAVWVANEVLADTPFESATFNLVVLDEDRLVLEDLETDHPFNARAKSVTVVYKPLDVLNGIVDSVSVVGLQATLTPDQIAAVTASDAPADEPPVTIGRLTVDDGRVSVLLGERQIDLTLDGEITSLEPLSGMLDVAVAGDDFNLAGPITITSNSSAGQTVSWRIDSGDVQRDALSLPSLSGQILIDGPASSASPLMVDISLNAPRSNFAAYDGGPFNLDIEAAVSLSDVVAIKDAAAIVELGTATDPIHAYVTANLFDTQALTTAAKISIGRDLTVAFGPNVTFTAPASLDARAAATLHDTWLDDIADLPDLALTLLSSMSATFESAGIDIDGYATLASVAADLSLIPDRGETAIVIGDGTQVSDLVIDPGIVSSWELPADLLGVLEAPMDVAVTSGERPLMLRDRESGGHVVDGVLGLDLTQADQSVSLRVDGKADLSASSRVETALIRDSSFVMAAASLGGFDGLTLSGHGQAEFRDQVLHAELEIDGAADQAVVGSAKINDLALTFPLDTTWDGGRFTISALPVVLVSATAAQFGDIRSGPVELDLPLRLTGTPEAFSFFLDDDGWIDLTGLTHPRFVIDQPASIKLEQMGLALLTVEFDDDNYPVWDARLKVAPPSATVTILDEDGLPTATVTGTLPRIGVSANQLIASYLTATLETSGGSLTWVEQDVSASGLKTLVTYNTGLSPWPQLQLEIAALEDLTSPKRFATMASDIRIAPVWPQGDDVRMSLNVHAPDRRYALNVEASYQPEKDLATALVRLPPLLFQPGGYQPADLSPMLASSAKDVSGSIGITGDVTWQSGVWSSDLDFALREISATAYGIRIERLNGLINLDNVMPPSTPPGQLVAIGGIDAGLPLRDALLSLALNRDGSLSLESAEMKFAGGEVTADPLVWHPESDPEPLNLHVSGVDVGTLFALAELDDLTATGTLDGIIPVRLVGDDVLIEGAYLASREPGQLRYLPDGAPTGLGADDASIDLVLSALSNFHYDRLDVDLSRAAGGDTEIGLHIAGSNPDLYDGYPIELNVNLTGELDRIVRDSLAGYRIPDEIRERLSGF
ncbi:MAG: YdbH domain-containing protein [Pseudomonadota bacterium]